MQQTQPLSGLSAWDGLGKNSGYLIHVNFVSFIDQVISMFKLIVRSDFKFIYLLVLNDGKLLTAIQVPRCKS